MNVRFESSPARSLINLQCLCVSTSGWAPRVGRCGCSVATSSVRSADDVDASADVSDAAAGESEADACDASACATEGRPADASDMFGRVGHRARQTSRQTRPRPRPTWWVGLSGLRLSPPSADASEQVGGSPPPSPPLVADNDLRPMCRRPPICQKVCAGWRRGA